ncbi:MAG: hypothetical protein IJN39_02270 [Clostridia bacterium]|nr:hypothetical protein [Clostridia bacterium]
MNIKTELLKNFIASYIEERIEDFEIDADKIADSSAIEIVGLVQGVLKNDELDDIEMIEEIVKIFEKFGLDTGSCHDLC